MNITVIGCGSWGTAIGNMLSLKHNVFLWCRREEIATEINVFHTNYKYLPKIDLDPKLKASPIIDEVIKFSDLVVIAVPSKWFRNILKDFKEKDLENKRFVILSKGLEDNTFMTLDEVLADELKLGEDRIAVLSGPTHAEDVVKSYPSAAIVASKNENLSTLVRDSFSNSFFRLYTSKDIKGVELGGALKNIYAAAAGIIDGFQYGDNAKAALLTRSIPEMIRLGVKLGAKPRTFMGLSGIGDLMVTAYSKHSRNRYLGEAIAKTKKPAKDVVDSMTMVAESYYSSKSFYHFSKINNLYTPILDIVYSIFYENKDLKELQTLLLSKPLKDEYEGDEFWLEKF